MQASEVLDKEQLNAIYQDILARIQMGLTSNSEGELDPYAFNEAVKDAILEKMPEKPKDVVHLDLFSTAFGVMCERILREHYRQHNREWW